MDGFFYLPVPVAFGGLVRIEVFGGSEPRGSVDGCDRPVPLLDEVVVAGAEQDAIVNGGGAACCPGNDVVGFAPRRGHGAVREGAPLVTSHQSPSHVRGEEALGTSDVKDLPCSAEHNGQDIGLTGQLPDAPALIC